MKVTYLIHTEDIKHEWIDGTLYSLCKLKADTVFPYVVVVDKHFPIECWESGVHELFYHTEEEAEEKYTALVSEDYIRTYL